MSRLRVAILGYGGRGELYARICESKKSEFEICAVIDCNHDKLAVAKQKHRLSDSQLFDDADKFFGAGMPLDYLFVCTQDKDHLEHSIKGLNLGYNLLLEKPIATSIEECREIEKTAKEKGLNVVVCHVLRYAPYYRKIKEIIDSGVLGRMISLEQNEDVAYWHQAHSFVRGHWRNSETSTPMIIAKCCHDLDIAVYLIGAKCETVSSMGELKYFKRENAPEGATQYCLGGCKVKDKCPYDCEKIYIDTIKGIPDKALRYRWPQSALVSDGIATRAKLYEAMKTGPWGRCVFMCDNNVVDYQTVTMQFENGVTSTLIMTAYSNGQPRRETRVRGTLGEIICDMEAGIIYLDIFGKRRKKIKVGLRGDSHGGGDARLVSQLADGKFASSIEMSMESHMIGFLAEKSRLAGGMPMKVADYRYKD